MDNIKRPLVATFNGISQVTFLQKPWFGLTVFIGLLLIDGYTALNVILASFTSYLIAEALYDKDYAVSGLAAFNSVLLVLMVEAFLGGFNSVIWVIPTTIICMGIHHVFKILLEKVSLVPLALPTVFSAYLMMYLNKLWPGVFFSDKLSFPTTTMFDSLTFGWLDRIILSGGDIYLQASVAFALILTVAFLVFEREYIIYLLTAYFFSLGIFYLFSLFFDIDPMNFTTFNILLTMMGLKAFDLLPMNKYLLPKLFLISLAVIVVKFLYDYLLGIVGLPSIVLAFVTVVDAVLIYKNKKEVNETLEHHSA